MWVALGCHHAPLSIAYPSRSDGAEMSTSVANRIWFRPRGAAAPSVPSLPARPLISGTMQMARTRRLPLAPGYARLTALCAASCQRCGRSPRPYPAGRPVWCRRSPIRSMLAHLEARRLRCTCRTSSHRIGGPPVACSSNPPDADALSALKMGRLIFMLFEFFF